MRFKGLGIAALFGCGGMAFAWGQPEIVFREEARPELNAVRRWAEISTSLPEDELNGVVFKFDAVAVDKGGCWTMPAHRSLIETGTERTGSVPF